MIVLLLVLILYFCDNLQNFLYFSIEEEVLGLIE